MRGSGGYQNDLCPRAPETLAPPLVSRACVVVVVSSSSSSSSNGSI